MSPPRRFHRQCSGIVRDAGVTEGRGLSLRGLQPMSYCIDEGYMSDSGSQSADLLWRDVCLSYYASTVSTAAWQLPRVGRGG